MFYWIFLFQSLFPLFLPKFMGVHFPFECLKYSLKNLHLGTAREKAMQIDVVVLVTAIVVFTENVRGKRYLGGRACRRLRFKGNSFALACMILSLSFQGKGQSFRKETVNRFVIGRQKNKSLKYCTPLHEEQPWLSLDFVWMFFLGVNRRCFYQC